MSSNNNSTGTPPVANAPVPEAAAASVAASQQPTQAARQQTTTQSLGSTSTAGAQPSVGSEDVQNCQWENCSARFASASALYEHLCEQHIGRKSTNNLNLTCKWGSCRTSTVKRDHITSHMRVHVPLKPHKCDFCGKSFKRPQDLKKHVKTHADDSVLLRSPDPARGGGPGGYRPAGATLPSDLQSLAATAQGYYPGTDLGSNGGYGAAPGGPPAAGYYNAPQGSQYGPVYYSVSQPAPQSESYETKKQLLLDALNEFFGQAKRNDINPRAYYDVSSRLSGIAGVEIPIASGYGGGFGGSFNGGTAVAGGPGHRNTHEYALPLPNLKTKSDLAGIDQFLDQLQTTVLENETQAAAAGVAQAGTHYVLPGVHHRSSHSPPTDHHAAHPVSSHVNAYTPLTTAAESGTPALTPASSVASYTAGQSPGSVHSHHSGQTISPSHRAPQSSMYPTLPSVHAMSDPATSGAPTANLGASFDDGRRRYSGGMLQKAAPPRSEDAMDISPAHEGLAKGDELHKGVDAMSLRSPSAIDPALDPALVDSDDRKDEDDEDDEDDEEQRRSGWLANVRAIEWIREIVKYRLDNEIYDGGKGDRQEGEAEAGSSPATPTQAKYPWTEGADEESKSKMEDDKRDEESLYPVLRAALEEHANSSNS